MIPPKVVCEITQDQIQARVRELASEISKWNGTEPLVAIGVLKSGFVFFSDLVRRLNFPVRCEFITIASTETAETRSGELILTLDTATHVAGNHVLLIDDIINTGLTMAYLVRLLKSRGAKAVRACALGAKTKKSVIPLPIDYLGFELDDRCFVGYGMDYCGYFRELPFIGTTHHESNSY